MDTTTALGLITAAGSSGYLVGVKAEMQRQQKAAQQRKQAEKARKEKGGKR